MYFVENPDRLRDVPQKPQQLLYSALRIGLKDLFELLLFSSQIIDLLLPACESGKHGRDKFGTNA